MAALAICAVTAAQLKDRTDTQAPPPVRPDQPPPPEPGMIPLTIPEIKRLLAARTARRCPGGSLSTGTRGPVSSASATTRSCGTPTRKRSVSVSGTFPPDSPGTPASASSRSVPTGPGKTRSSPAGNGYAPCQHLHDQHESSRQHERRTVPAPSEPVRTRAHRAPPPVPPPAANRHLTLNRAPAQSVTRPQKR